MTRTEFRTALVNELAARYEWAWDGQRLKKALDAINATLAGGKQCNIDGESWVAAWRKCGGKGKPTYKALHALPSEEPTP